MTDDLELARNRFDCCDHCEHEDRDPYNDHASPCPEGCNDE